MEKARKILLVTDAWLPQTNGVVRSLTNTVRELRAKGHKVEVLHPELFINFPCPVYPEIRIAFPNPLSLRKLLLDFDPDHIHIATEGSLGWLSRILLRRLGKRFTTSFHTMFPDYLYRFLRFPPAISWRVLKRFHRSAESTFVPTESIRRRLMNEGFRNLRIWSRGIDRELFRPRPSTRESSIPGPVATYIGRVSSEKNIEAFLDTDFHGSKVVVGDGPMRATLQRRYPEVHFLGFKHGEELAQAYANSDVFVFPSLTDTFGNVILESLASGVPVAAYPAPGPRDILTVKGVGALHEDLSVAIKVALEQGCSKACIEHAAKFSWESCTEDFLSFLSPSSASGLKQQRLRLGDRTANA